MIYNSFGDSLKRLERKLKIIDGTIGNVRAFFDCGNTYQMYEHALKLEEQMEQAVLLSRTLPAYTGKPLAQAEVSNIERLNIPLEIGFTKEGWFSLRIPALLPKKSEGSAEYVRSFLYPAMKEFFEGLAPVRYTDCILIYRHVYDEKRPERRMRDHDNIEINMVSDIVAIYVMPDDGPEICSHYYCSAKGQTNRTEVYVLPKSEFAVWLTIENSMPDEGVKLYESPVFWKEKHM